MAPHPKDERFEWEESVIALIKKKLTNPNRIIADHVVLLDGRVEDDGSLVVIYREHPRSEVLGWRRLREVLQRDFAPSDPESIASAVVANEIGDPSANIRHTGRSDWGKGLAFHGQLILWHGDLSSGDDTKPLD